MNILIAYFGIWGFVIMLNKKTIELFNHKHTAEQEAILCHNCTEYGAMERIVWAMVIARMIPVFCGVMCGFILCFGCCFYAAYFRKVATDENVEGIAPEFKLWAGK